MPTDITSIKRYPLRKNDLLQGWDSADQLLLQHLATLELAGKRILIVNDQFGALSLGLEGEDCTTYTDSFVSSMAIRLNSQQRIQPINDLDRLSGFYDVVAIQLPKNSSFFEDILCRLSHHLRPGSLLVCGQMIKHLSKASFDLLQRYIGPTTTSLAQKKARLVFAAFERAPVESPYPLTLKVDAFPFPLTNHSNLFSRDKLDIGTRFFLEHVPAGNFKRILDLGCANGVLGIRAKLLNPKAKLVFSDESFMAIKSARTNFAHLNTDEAEFHWTNCFEGQPEDDLDLVLCNPPFHQQNVVGDFIALQMFQDAHRSLRPGGILRVIGNSHLGYQVKLGKLFGNCKILRTNNKFMVCESRKA